jgi:hypothetical protein
MIAALKDKKRLRQNAGTFADGFKKTKKSNFSHLKILNFGIIFLSLIST